jgi:NAD(P)-dependent dehydrogenase (short-subunit alcohol dehydrogenase family)
VTVEPDDALLTGRVAVVTGGGAGIGAACATALARFGCDVAVCDRQPDGLPAIGKAIDAIGRRADIRHLDVRDAEATSAWLAEVDQRFGRIDILVNNAGGTFRGAFAEQSPNADRTLLAENFGQVSSTIKAALPYLARQGGSIVNITSIEAHRAAPGFATYAAAKAAVANLSQSLALELADQRIRVNCIAPDVIPTPGLGPAGDAIREAAERGEARHPWPDAGTPDDVAAAVVWLAGDLARFVTGTTIHVDGGTDAARGWRRTPDGPGWSL